MYKEYIVRVYCNKKTEWRNKEGNFHREDGPAVEWNDSYKAWYLNGVRHREDGPAREWISGDKEWYLNGKRLTEEEFNNRMNKCEEKIITIDGEDFKLVKV